MRGGEGRDAGAGGEKVFKRYHLREETVLALMGDWAGKEVFGIRTSWLMRIDIESERLPAFETFLLPFFFPEAGDYYPPRTNAVAMLKYILLS